jgi:hypothetical protein
MIKELRTRDFLVSENIKMSIKDSKSRKVRKDIECIKK